MLIEYCLNLICIFQTYLQSSMLSVSAIAVFLRRSFLLKLILMVITISVHIIVYSYFNMFQDEETENDKYVINTIPRFIYN